MASPFDASLSSKCSMLFRYLQMIINQVNLRIGNGSSNINTVVRRIDFFDGRPDRHLWLRRRGSAPAAAAKYYILPLQFLQFSRWYPHRPRRRAAPPGGSARASGKRRYTYQYMRDRPGYVPIFACPDKKISGARLRAVFPLLFYLPHI